MSWFRVCAWILLAAVVIMLLGGYVSQWYRQQVSSSLDRMFAAPPDDGRGRYQRLPNDEEEEPQVAVAAPRSVTADQELTALDTGYVDDDE